MERGFFGFIYLSFQHHSHEQIFNTFCTNLNGHLFSIKFEFNINFKNSIQVACNVIEYFHQNENENLEKSIQSFLIS